jgi:hypothetical protein
VIKYLNAEDVHDELFQVIYERIKKFDYDSEILINPETGEHTFIFTFKLCRLEAEKPSRSNVIKFNPRQLDLFCKN